MTLPIRFTIRVATAHTGLFVVVAFADHQSPIDFSQSRIDPSCSIGRQVERAFDAVIAGLGDALARLVSAARRVGTWKQTAKAAELVQSCETPSLMQNAEHERRRCVADPRDRAECVRWMKFAVEHFDFAAELAKLAFQQTHSIDLDRDFQLQKFEVYRSSTEAPRLDRCSFEAVHRLVRKRTGMGMVATYFATSPSNVVRRALMTSAGLNMSCRIPAPDWFGKSGNTASIAGDAHRTKAISLRLMVATSASRRSR